MNKKAQSSLEFLSIFAIGFLLVMIVGGTFLAYSNSAKNSFDKAQLEKVTSELIFNIESVYFQGEGSKYTQLFNFPKGIENMTMHQIYDGTRTYDYLNITYVFDGVVVNELLTAKQNFIRFNCQTCYKDISDLSHNVSWFNESDFTKGSKKISLKNVNSTVMIRFVKE